MTDIAKTNDRIWAMVGAAKRLGGPTYGIEPTAEAASCITKKLDGLLNSEFPGDNDRGLALLECDLNTLELGAAVAFRRCVRDFMIETKDSWEHYAETLAETDVLHKALDVVRAINEQAESERHARQVVQREIEKQAAQKRADELGLERRLFGLKHFGVASRKLGETNWDIGLSGSKTKRGAVSFGDLPGGKMDHADIAENTKRSHAGDFEPKQYCPHDMLWTSLCAECGRMGEPALCTNPDELDDYGLKCGSCGAYHTDEQPIGSKAWAKHVAQSAAYSRREFDMAPKALAEAERLENELASHGFASDGSGIVGAAQAAGYERAATAPERADQDAPQQFFNADGTPEIADDSSKSLCLGSKGA